MKKFYLFSIIVSFLLFQTSPLFAEDISGGVDDASAIVQEEQNGAMTQDTTDEHMDDGQNEVGALGDLEPLGNLLEGDELDDLGDPLGGNDTGDVQSSVDTSLIQDTYNSQETDAVDILNGEDDGVEIQTAVAEDGENLDEDVPESTEDNPMNGLDTDLENSEDQTMEEEMVDEEYIDEEGDSISYEELKPKSIYTFSLTHKTIGANKTRKNSDLTNFEKSKKIDNDIVPDIDNDLGVMEVSGICNSEYYTILLYKNKDDYALDPNKYILNRAFPCESGKFDYEINDLPTSLEDGKYYLLVGQQGDTGSWVPISDLTEIRINKSL